ncbi:IS66 family transposase [Candidatus Contendibacter odensensis]|uniref:Transposase n=1 Tax=Candidatus Contendobacter odensis Run_B_J11 TaxID=1400861 RepID=A0A7U7J545_9GAMM|nr:IS66 family transposase [Candidatus Contendobacter odensis]CDH45975.1 transposase [Candidatus Contendobacter odensis Run_B_J11]
MEPNVSIDYKSLYEQSLLRLTALEQQLQQLQKMIFGSRHERFIPSDINPSQLSLNIKAEPVAAVNLSAAKKITYVRTGTSIEQKPLVHPGRMKLPESLRREEIIIEPAADVSNCKKMGEEITEVLEWQPGELFVKKYVRIKYARLNGSSGQAKPGNSGVLIGELPVRPLDKAMAGAGLLAQIVIDKYVDHLPLYRQMQRFERSGLKLPYSTLTDWVSATCKLIEPLYEALKASVMQSNYLHADETPIKVLDKDKKGTTHRGYYWVYQNSIKKSVFFDYRQGRGREGPQGILEHFKGYLQTDGYIAYEIFNKNKDIKLMHCMAHARRMFHDALDNDKERAQHALEQIQHLYTIERICKEQGLNFPEITEVRQQKSLPILGALGKWMKEQYMQTTPKSGIGKALAYSIERWQRLSLYANTGMLNIDNNPVENSIRPVALGRKNYLFAGSHEAAQRSAMLYSLLGTCKMNGIEPYAWLHTTLEKIATHPINRIKELLPFSD